MIAMMLREHDLMARTDLSSVQFVRMGSAPVSQSLMQALHRALPQAKVTNAYGTTEAGPVVFGPHPRGLPQPETSVGYPHPKVAVRLVDGGDRAATQGELEMKCPAMMLGYHNRPDLPVPITADGFYRTGDVFRRDADGFYYFLGRTDDMFVSGGENIYPGDVERMLERHPAVAQATVVPIDDDIKGTKPVAFIIAKGGGRCRGDQALRARQRAGLSAPALRVVRRPPAALHHQQDRPRGPDADGGGASQGDGGGAMTGVDRRLPAGDEIFLDHVAHFVADADAAARALAQAGFTTTPQSIQVNPDAGGGPPQPTGTGQRHGDARPRLHRVPVQDGGHAARQAVRYRDGEVPGAASRRLRGGGRRRHPCAARDRRIRAAAGGRHAPAGRDA